MRLKETTEKALRVHESGGRPKSIVNLNEKITVQGRVKMTSRESALSVIELDT